MQFPLLASVRVHFRVKNSDETQGTQPQVIVVEAHEQDLEQIPNMSNMNLLTLMAECRPVTDGLVASQLHQICASPRYAQEAEFGTCCRACDKVLALVMSTTKAVQENLGGNACRLTTPGIKDGLAVVDGTGGDTEFTLVGTCADANLKDVLLDPPRPGKRRQPALAVITAGTGDNTFMLEIVQLLTEGGLSHAVPSIKKLQHLSESAKFSISGEQPDWSQPDSGLLGSAKKCRRLSRIATDVSIPDAPVLSAAATADAA